MPRAGARGTQEWVGRFVPVIHGGGVSLPQFWFHSALVIGWVFLVIDAWPNDCPFAFVPATPESFTVTSSKE